MSKKYLPRIMLPTSAANLLRGAVIQWEDETPLSDHAQGELEFYFDVRLGVLDRLRLRKYGIYDVSHIVNARLRWRVTMTMHYAGAEPITHSFVMLNPIFPMGQKFITERDKFYLACQLENILAPEQHTFISTRFKAVCLGA